MKKKVNFSYVLLIIIIVMIIFGLLFLINNEIKSNKNENKKESITNNSKKETTSNKEESKNNNNNNTESNNLSTEEKKANNDQIKNKSYEVKEMHLNGDENITIKLNEKYEELGATATNVQGEDISDKIEIVSKVDNTKEGTYKVYYSIGNWIVVRYVTVK